MKQILETNLNMTREKWEEWKIHSINKYPQSPFYVPEKYAG